MARPNREILTGGKKYKDSKRSKHRVDEVSFDSESRTQYLTGFHKRKVERKKNAQKHAEEMAKKDRVEERARIREERKEQIRKKLDEMKAAMELNPFLKNDESSEEESDSDDKKDKKKKNVGWGNDDSDDDGQTWNGINEDGNSEAEKESDGEDNESNSVKSILKKQVYEIDSIDAPVTGHSEVVIESLDNPNSTSAPYVNLTSVAEQMNVDLEKSGEILDESIKRAKKYARLLGVADTKPENEKPKQKKKKFRYLSKAERKVRTTKEKAVAAKRSARGRERKDKK